MGVSEVRYWFQDKLVDDDPERKQDCVSFQDWNWCECPDWSIGRTRGFTFFALPPMSPQTGRTTTSYTRYRVAHTVWQKSGGHSDRRGVNNYLCRVERMWPCRSTWTRPSCQSGWWSASSRSFSAWWAWSSNSRHHPDNHHHHHRYWKSAASSKHFLVRSLLRAEPGSHELGSGLIFIIIIIIMSLLLPL